MWSSEEDRGRASPLVLVIHPLWVLPRRRQRRTGLIHPLLSSYSLYFTYLAKATGETGSTCQV